MKNVHNHWGRKQILCFVFLPRSSRRCSRDNRRSIMTPKCLYKNTCLIFSIWITIGTSWDSDGESDLFRFICVYLKRFVITQLEPLCFHRFGLSESFNKDQKTVSSGYLRMYWFGVSVQSSGVVGKNNSWAHTVMSGVPTFGLDSSFVHFHYLDSVGEERRSKVMNQTGIQCLLNRFWHRNLYFYHVKGRWKI